MEKYLLILISAILSPFTESFFKQLEKNKTVNQTVNLYPNKTFVKIRFWDAPFIEVEKIIPKTGRILDLGCGEGIFTNFLALSSNKRKIIGLEIDKDRIKQADWGIKNVSFKYANVTKHNFPKSDCIILFHLLHHLSSYSDQEKVLEKCSRELSKGGKLIIVEVEPELSYKYLLAYLTDHFIVPWIFERRFFTPAFFRDSQKWIWLVERLGFSCTMVNVSKDKPFSHRVFICSKK